MKRLVLYIKDKFGISQLENKVIDLQKENRNLKLKNETVLNKLEQVRNINETIVGDNTLIRGHLNFINSEFKVASDINPSRYDPSVVIVMKRGEQDIIKTYQFRDETVEHIYRMLEGFGKENNKIDKPRHMPGPNFRY